MNRALWASGPIWLIVGCGASPDADGDGFTADVDCDDGSVEVSPDRPEVCDGIDNDCDGSIDVDPVDGVVFYADADGDGAGDPSVTVTACARPEGHVERADDCDDTSADVHPDRAEICDGIDNDCDVVIDANRVPADHATVQAAIDAVPDGAVVCVAPGTYSAAIDATDRQVSVVAAAGPATTSLSLSAGAAPLVTAGGAKGDLVLQGFTVTGLLEETSPGRIEAGLLRHTAGAVTLEDVHIDNVEARLSGATGAVSGGLVHSGGGSLTLRDVAVDGYRITTGATGGEGPLTVVGGLVQVGRTALQIDGLAVTGGAITARDIPGGATVAGGLIFVDDSMVQASGVSIVNSTVSIDGAGLASVDGALASLVRSELGLEGWEVREADVDVGTDLITLTQGLLHVAESEGTVDGLDLHDLSLSASAAATARARGVLALIANVGLEVRHVSATGSDVSAAGPTGRVEGGTGFVSGSAELRWIDVRGGQAQGTTEARGGALYVDAEGGDVGLRHVVMAGNRVGVATATVGEGGGLYADPAGGTVAIAHADLVGNLAEGALAQGGAVTVELSVGGAVTLDNATLHANTVSGTTELGAAMNATGATAPQLTYTNVHLNQGPAAISGFPDPVGVSGNVDLDPAYVDRSESDPTTWDLQLTASSAVVDQGDPALQDDDGTRCDIGAYGGPGGSDW